MAVEEINAAGGINGYQIDFKFEDDVHDAEKSVNAYNTLKDWGMQMLMGTVTSTPCQAVVEESHNDNMFQLTPSGSAIESIKYDNAFRVCFSDPNQGVGAAQYIGQNNLAEKVAVIYNSSDVYSSGIYEKFAAEAANQPFEVVAAEAFTDDSKTDFTVQLQKAKDAGADLIFLPIYYQEASLILQQVAAMDYSPKFFGCDGLDGLKALLEVDNKIADIEGEVSYMTPFDAEAQDEKTKNFVAAYKEAYKVTPDQFAADGYDAVYVLYEAMKKADVKDVKISASDLCEILKTTISADDFSFTGTTGGMTWDASGAPAKEPVIVKLS